ESRKTARLRLAGVSLPRCPCRRMRPRGALPPPRSASCAAPFYHPAATQRANGTSDDRAAPQKQSQKRRRAPLLTTGSSTGRALQQGVFVLGLEPLPAPLHLGGKLLQHFLVLGPEQVAGLAHELEPVLHRDALVPVLGVVRDGRDAPLDLIQREEAAVDRRLHDLRPQAILAAPVQGAGDEHL